MIRSLRPTFLKHSWSKFPTTRAAILYARGYATATPEEVEELRQATVDFCKAEITPAVAHQTDLENNFPNQLWKKMGDAGLLGITAAEEYGGLKAGYMAHLVVMEELSRASGSIGLSYVAHSNLCINQLSRYVTPEQGKNIYQILLLVIKLVLWPCLKLVLVPMLFL